MLHVLALLAATSVEPMVSTAWLQAHLTDPQVRIVFTGDRGDLRPRPHSGRAVHRSHGHRRHADGRRGMDHRMLPLADLAKALAAKAGAADGTHIVLYGDSPMQTGWIYMTLAAIGHADDVSMLDGGINLWRARRSSGVDRRAARSRNGTSPSARHPTSSSTPPTSRSGCNRRTSRSSTCGRRMEWNNGHLPGATLILWQDLYADQRMQKFKSIDEIRALITKTGVTPNQSVVTYCAVGLRASLMYWAARAAGIPARVYVGSWQDWQRDSSNPIVQ